MSWRDRAEPVTNVSDWKSRATPVQSPQEEIPVVPDSSMMDVAKQAVKEAAFAPGTLTRSAATDPVTQAKILPALAGAGGAIMGGPFSMSKAQLAGRALSDAALAAYGKSSEIPSMGSHALEAATTIGLDAAAIPYLHKSSLGPQIGEAENAAGVITRAPDKLPTAGNVGEYLNTLESQIDNGTINSAQAARDAYAGTRYINSNPSLVGKSNEISVQAARVGSKAQALLNKLVPGRGEAAGEMARVMQVPNAVGRTVNKIPPTLRKTLIPFAVLEEYLRRFH